MFSSDDPHTGESAAVSLAPWYQAPRGDPVKINPRLELEALFNTGNGLVLISDEKAKQHAQQYETACAAASFVWHQLLRPARSAEEEARVLILNGLDPYLPAYLAIDGAMRASLANETSRRIVLYSEPLDAQRFAIEPRESEIVAAIAKKYGNLRIDVVVTVMKPALDFFKRHGEQLWPDARLVFHGIPDPDSELVTFPTGATGLVNQRSPNPHHRRHVAPGPGTGAAVTADRADQQRKWNSSPAGRCRTW
jgi:hypothetical protein